jgi:hypothetical protein
MMGKEAELKRVEILIQCAYFYYCMQCHGICILSIFIMFFAIQ